MFQWKPTKIPSIIKQNSINIVMVHYQEKKNRKIKKHSG